MAPVVPNADTLQRTPPLTIDFPAGHVAVMPPPLPKPLVAVTVEGVTPPGALQTPD